MSGGEVSVDGVLNDATGPGPTPLRILAAFDKFRHTATAAQLGDAVGDVGWEFGWDVASVPLADGGEGTLDVLQRRGGTLQSAQVHNALGRPIEASWLLRGTTAFVEMARASGLAQVGGAEDNDPLAATTRGTGELILAAINAGAKRIVVTLGGSATTDGGLGALQALAPLARLRGVQLLVACDVDTTFVDAARVFAPQKGASEAQVSLLTRRLERLADEYLAERGVDVRAVTGAGAAGGLAGGLVSIGARLESGFGLVAEELSLVEKIDSADVVVTGEGYFDDGSFLGKVVGGVATMARDAGKPVVVVCGGRQPDLEIPAHLTATIVEVVVLSELFGKHRSWQAPLQCVREALPAVLRAFA